MGTFNRTTPNKSKKLRKTEDITLAIIHYTGSLNIEGTLSWFENPDAKVSSHYVIGRDGRSVMFESRLHRLWHAGKSQWEGQNGCNRCSIGYELVATKESGFTHAQYATLRKSLQLTCKIFPITAIVGHEHVSPGRKVDPGWLFDWDELAGIPGIQWLGGERIVEPTVTVTATVEPNIEPGWDKTTLPWWKRWLS